MHSDSKHLTRDVKCKLCGKQMYYTSDPRFEAEVKITVELPKWQDPFETHSLGGCLGVGTHYVHMSCWNTTVANLVQK